MSHFMDRREDFALTLPACGLLMALGWAINGMIGNAPGAAIPGAFIAMAVAGILGLARDDRQEGSPAGRRLMRIAAFGAMGFWFGGEMTYGQTFSLTNANVDGGAHYWWGILGIAVKGSAWSGLGAAFIGLGLMSKRYRWREMALLLAGMTAASAAGLMVLNRPLDPSQDLPLICFSYDPVNPDTAPRTECWGGLWVGLIVLLAYVRAIKKDCVTFRFGLFGILGGGLGFAVGQMLQAFSWAHSEFAFRPWVDWWKVMEMTHGFVVGVFVALAALLTPTEQIQAGESEKESFSPIVEWAGIVIWLTIIAGYFLRHPIGDFLAVFPFVGGILVFSGLTAGRWWPWIIVGVQVPLATGLITSNEGMHTFPGDTGYSTPGGDVISLFQVLGYAWPMMMVAVLVCAVPTAVWLYRRSPRKGVSRSVIRVFIGYHVFAVVVQMVWRTLRWAPSWSPADLFLYARPFYLLIGLYLFYWVAATAWFSRAAAVSRREC